jgi:A/G-specific adenine glycosylase
MPDHHCAPLDTADLQRRLLDWYDRHRRVLPWRAPAGQRPDPYHVWLSEIMLQQTTVPVVGDYFRTFLARWPTVHDLAAATLDDVLREWAGLGYYARARNLHRCAQVVSDRHQGRFPEDEQELRQLPGVGDYTAAAIAAIAFDRPAAVMDGNVERVVSRLGAVTEPLPAAKPALKALTAALTPTVRPGDHAQAMMDLGATVCTPRRPKCILCPWQASCAARRAGIAEQLPAKRPKAAKPLRRAVAFWLVNGTGAVLLRRRPETGLLGGMMEIPSTSWEAGPMPDTEAAAAAAAPTRTGWRLLPGIVRHGFTHFDLEVSVLAGRVGYAPPLNGRWVAIEALGDEALPTVMRKIVRHALMNTTDRADRR